MTRITGKLTNLTLLAEINGETGFIAITPTQAESIINYLTHSSKDGVLTLISIPEDMETITLHDWEENSQIH